MTEQASLKQSKTNVSAGIAGAGGGTVVVMLANSFPEGSQAQAILLHAAPTLTVAIGALTKACIERIKKYIRNKDIDKAVKEAKSSLSETLKNPETSDEHKSNIRKSLEQLEMLDVQAKMENVKGLLNTSVQNNPNKALQRTSR